MTPHRIQAAAKGLALSPQEGITPGLAKRIAAHNEAASQVFSSIESAEQSIAEAVSGAADAETDLYGSLETRKFANYEAARSTVQLWRQRGELAEAVAAEFRPEIEPSEKVLADVIETTEAGLAKLGITADAMQAGGWNSAGAKNPTAAAQQLRHIASQAIPVREATATVTNLKNVVSASITQVRDSERAFEVARSAVTNLASKAALAHA